MKKLINLKMSLNIGLLSRVSKTNLCQYLILLFLSLLISLVTANAQQNSVQLLKDINTSTNNFSSLPEKFLTSQGVSYFAGFDPLNGRELWRTDGSDNGTVFIKDIRPGSGSFFPVPVAAIGSTVFFVADYGSVGNELWKTDGTPAGTVLIKDINPGAAGGVQGFAAGFAVLNNVLYFVANDGVRGLELWKSDGTTAGTTLVKDVEPGSSGSIPTRLAVANNNLYFVTSFGLASPNNGFWKSDGTSGGTEIIRAGVYDSLVEAGSRLFFFRTGANELWTSDGTSGGKLL